MGSQVYRENYLAALEVAHSQLDQIICEFESLQLRKEKIENVVGALQFFLPSAPPVRIEACQREPIPAEPARIVGEPEIVQRVLRAASMSAAEPIAPQAFSPASESGMDPIQHRINRALGLAVA